MDAAKRGSKALADGKLDLAIDCYTTAIKEHPESVDYYCMRSTCYRRSEKVDLAMADVENAVFFAFKREKRELIAKAQLERGIVYYRLERWADAHQCFQWSEESAKDNRLPIWLAKVQEKLDSQEKSDGAKDPTHVSSIKKVPDVDIERVKTTALQAQPKSSASSSTDTPAATTAAAAPQKIRYDWYQTAEAVTVTILAKRVPKDKAEIEIQPDSLSVSFPLPGGSDYALALEPLFGKVNVSLSSYRVLESKVEITLRKGEQSKWAALEAPARSSDNSAVKAPESGGDNVSKPFASAPSSGPPQYPTSSRTGPKDWSKFDEHGDDADDDEDAAGDPNAFFKKLYKGTDDDTRRAMIKSFQESNGTALSTNWADVSKKSYETMPPDGTEAKSW